MKSIIIYRQASTNIDLFRDDTFTCRRLLTKEGRITAVAVHSALHAFVCR